jgi:hypothetical protein
VVFEDSEDIFEIGIDFEKFLEGTNHHFSIGIATEVDFKNHKNDYYFGPLFSFYYIHTKTFFSTGVLTDFEGNNEWKSRLGLGYELVLANHLLVIPYIAIDYVNDEINPTAGIGIAYEFL